VKSKDFHKAFNHNLWNILFFCYKNLLSANKPQIATIFNLIKNHKKYLKNIKIIFTPFLYKYKSLFWSNFKIEALKIKSQNYKVKDKFNSLKAMSTKTSVAFAQIRSF